MRLPLMGADVKEVGVKGYVVYPRRWWILFLLSVTSMHQVGNVILKWACSAAGSEGGALLATFECYNTSPGYLPAQPAFVCVANFLQSNVWSTYSPIVGPVQNLYGWSSSTVDILAAWGPIVYMPLCFVCPRLVERIGLRATITLAISLVSSQSAPCVSVCPCEARLRKKRRRRTHKNRFGPLYAEAGDCGLHPPFLDHRGALRYHPRACWSDFECRRGAARCAQGLVATRLSFPLFAVAQHTLIMKQLSLQHDTTPTACCCSSLPVPHSFRLLNQSQWRSFYLTFSTRSCCSSHVHALEAGR